VFFASSASSAVNVVIAKAERSLASRRGPEWSLFTDIVREIEMQNNTEWSKKYYSDEARAKIDERRTQWSPELQEQVTRDWTALYADVDAAMRAGEDPAGAKAQALAARWRTPSKGSRAAIPKCRKG
jgi:hypothetical protein